MPDIRLVRPRANNLWLWTGGLVSVALLVLVFSLFFGDPTEAAKQRQVGARADFGADRAPVIPVVSTPFPAVTALGERDVGRLVRLEGWAESRVRGNAVWVRATDGRRILLRVEPPPAPGTAIPFVPGGRVSAEGYLQRIAEAELRVWLDSLGVWLPRPTPSQKFGDLPDSNFVRVDSLFIKNYYVSVRPETLGAGRRVAGAGAGR